MSEKLVGIGLDSADPDTTRPIGIEIGQVCQPRVVVLLLFHTVALLYSLHAFDVQLDKGETI